MGFQKDLTGGNTAKQLIMFSLPFLLSNFLQALYGIADMIIVSWFAGINSQSGVAIGSQVTLLVTNMVLGLGVGGTVMISQYIGMKRECDMSETVATLITLFVIAAASLTVIMIALSSTILKLLNTGSEAMGEASNYVNICMAGNIFIFGYNGLSAILRGMGDSKRPLIFVAIACVINVGLDLIMVGPLHMGAAGAAVATIISQAISMLLAVIYLIRKGFIFDFKFKSFKLFKDKVKKIFEIGIPTSVQNVIVTISFLFLTSLINGLHPGSEEAASGAAGAVGKFNGFAILPGIAMSAAIAAMAGQNIGAGLYKRAEKTMYIGMIIALVIGALSLVVVQLFPDALLKIFNAQGEMLGYGRAFLLFVSIDYVIAPVLFAHNGLINGSGHTKVSMATNIISSILVRMPAAYILGKTLGMGMSGIGLAVPISTAFALVIAFIYVRSGRWKTSVINKSAIERIAEDVAQDVIR
jgi:putative MATE family efflux protein